MTYTVKIDENDSNYVERLFYLSNSRRDNIAYLMRQDKINKDLLELYIDSSDKINIELEMAKEEAAHKYEPEELKGKTFDYNFDFERNTLTFEEVK